MHTSRNLCSDARVESCDFITPHLVYTNDTRSPAVELSYLELLHKRRATALAALQDDVQYLCDSPVPAGISTFVPLPPLLYPTGVLRVTVFIHQYPP